MTVVEPPTLRLGDRRIPVVLPSLRDARLHTAAVILSIHAIGVTALGFRVSVPQILSAILTAALVDVLITLRLTGKLVWPASGMLTGSGVALILRLVEMQAGDFWTWRGWHLYAAVAGLSVLTKYVIRWRGSHLFNPSNVGLVAAFLLLGSGVVEPLDFWWAPLGPWMLLAYAIIIGGGVAIIRRLDLLKMAVAFWTVLAAGLWILASGGHCMIASWSPEAVCGDSFWWVLVTSPEILVFQLFMITDPKTVPTGRRARIVFAGVLGVVATLLIAPHAAEYGAKVGLLASLVILAPVRRVFDRLVPETARRPGPVSSRRAFLQGVAIGWGLAVVSIGIFFAGFPAREGAVAITQVTEVPVEVDPSTLPAVSVNPEVGAVNVDVDAQGLAVTLAENLMMEAEAVRDGNGSLLALAATGDRLAELQQRVDDGISTGERVTYEYTFDSLLLGVAESAEGQSSAALSLRATGTEEEVTYDPLGQEISREAAPFEGTFELRRVGGDRWLVATAERSVDS